VKKIILYFLAFLGLVFITLIIFRLYNFYKLEKLAEMYSDNCQKVEVGMTLTQARDIIGGLKSHQFWASNKYLGEIKVSTENKKVVYYVEYPATFAASDNIQLYFNPNTLIITEIFCGE